MFLPLLQQGVHIFCLPSNSHIVPAYCHYELFQKQNYKPLACKQMSAHLSCPMISFQKSVSSMLPGSSTFPVAGTKCQTDFCHWFASVLSRRSQHSHPSLDICQTLDVAGKL